MCIIIVFILLIYMFGILPIQICAHICKENDNMTFNGKIKMQDVGRYSYFDKCMCTDSTGKEVIKEFK